MTIALDGTAPDSPAGRQPRPTCAPITLRARSWQPMAASRGTSCAGGTTRGRTPLPSESRNMAVVKTLTYLMFAMFAMTTDSVGIIIPGGHQDVPAVADGGRNVSVRDDGAASRWPACCSVSSPTGSGAGRTIVVGLTLFAAACFLLAAGRLLPVLRRDAGAVGTRHRRVQDRRAGAHRRHLDIDRAAHVDHEHRSKASSVSARSSGRRFSRACWPPACRGSGCTSSPARSASC